jgi:predicted kinase
MPKFIGLFGTSGSGKSTWAKKYVENDPYTIRVCADDIRKEITGNVSDMSQDGLVWKLVRERLHYALTKGHDVICDATNLKARNRNNVIKELPEGTEIVFKIFPVEPHVAKERIKFDLLKGVDRSKVPEDVVDRQYQDYLANVELVRKEWAILE